MNYSKLNDDEKEKSRIKSIGIIVIIMLISLFGMYFTIKALNAGSPQVEETTQETTKETEQVETTL